MHCRSFTLILAAVFFLVACVPAPMEGTALPIETVMPSVTETSVPPTQSPTATAIIQPALPTDWPSQLEVIQSGNWLRLQLLKVIPAEIPMDHSAVAISPDGKTMAMGSSSGAQIYFFDLGSGDLIQKVSFTGVSNADAYFNEIEYLSDGTLLANSDGPYAIYHIDAVGNVLSTWDGISFALSADKSTMAHDTIEGITLVDIARNTTLGSFEGGIPLDFSFSPDSSKIAVNLAGVDYVTTTIWDISSGTELVTLNEVGNVRYSPNGNFLAVTSYAEDTTPLKIFSPDGVAQLTTLSVDAPNGLNGKPPLFSLDGSVIVAQIANGSPVAWDTASWQPMEMPALEGELYSFSPDGRVLITRTSNGGILLWGVLPLSGGSILIGVLIIEWYEESGREVGIDFICRCEPQAKQSHKGRYLL